MNRRSFISTITALAGVVLAKIKAPGAALIRRRGVVMLTRCAWCQKVTPELLTYTAHSPDGLYHSAAVCRDCYDATQGTIVHGPVFTWIRSGTPGNYTYRPFKPNRIQQILLDKFQRELP